MKNIENIELIENLLKIGDYEKMYRIDYNGQRLYIRENPFKYYSGLTGALSASTFQGSPETKRLKKWREGMIDHLGKENADNWINMTADFGELVHQSVVTMKEKGKINWKEEEELAYDYFITSFKEKEIIINAKLIKSMVYEYLKHVSSIMQFIYERVQEIYAVETPARWEEFNIATPIDLFCKCRQTPKGEFFNTTINIKTSSQIGKHQLEQISCEFIMWNEIYDNAYYTGILRTKDWKEDKIPTYEYKSLDAGIANGIAHDISQRLRLCLNSDASYYPEPKHYEFNGITKIGEKPDIIITSIEEEWNKRNE